MYDLTKECYTSNDTDITQLVYYLTKECYTSNNTDATPLRVLFNKRMLDIKRYRHHISYCTI